MVPDYKEMYFQLFRATEQAMNVLIEAQEKAEEMYLSSLEPELTVLKQKYGKSQEDSTKD